jgi:hypothetical protein
MRRYLVTLWVGRRDVGKSPSWYEGPHVKTVTVDRVDSFSEAAREAERQINPTRVGGGSVVVVSVEWLGYSPFTSTTPYADGTFHEYKGTDLMGRKTLV